MIAPHFGSTLGKLDPGVLDLAGVTQDPVGQLVRLKVEIAAGKDVPPLSG